MKKRTLNGTESNVNNTSLRAPTISITRFAEDSSGTQHQIPHTDILCKLLYLDGKFFASDYQNFYCFKPDGTRLAFLSNVGYTISIGSVDGNIVYQTYSDMSEIVTVDKKQYFRDNLNGDHFYPDVNNDSIVNGRDWAGIINN
ncbi:MAG: hypothetical protein IJ235_06295 [Eubacterium sp.]|nr:hypothetical protein [Eubacterium sp.]